jgi:hypothetical protein
MFRPEETCGITVMVEICLELYKQEGVGGIKEIKEPGEVPAEELRECHRIESETCFYILPCPGIASRFDSFELLLHACLVSCKGKAGAVIKPESVNIIEGF